MECQCFQVKNTLWEGGVRGAGLLWSPLLKRPKRVASQIFHITDWLPTLYSAAGADAKYRAVYEEHACWHKLNSSHLLTELLATLMASISGMSCRPIVKRCEATSCTTSMTFTGMRRWPFILGKWWRVRLTKAAGTTGMGRPAITIRTLTRPPIWSYRLLARFCAVSAYCRVPWRSG